MSDQNLIPLTAEMYNDLLAERNELQADMKTIKDNVVLLLKTIGMMNEEGEMRESISMPSLLSTIGGLATGNKKAKEKFHFLSECSPLITKYKDL